MFSQILDWFCAEICERFWNHHAKSSVYDGMNPSSPPSLFDNQPSNTSHSLTSINPSLSFCDCDGYRVISCRHEILYRLALTDAHLLAVVAVATCQSQLATQTEIATAFGHSVATQRRWETRYLQQGSDGLRTKTPTGRNPELDPSQRAFVLRWFEAGVSNREIARRLAVGEATIRHVLRQAGLRRRGTPAAELPFTAAPTPETPLPQPVPVADAEAAAAGAKAAAAPPPHTSPVVPAATAALPT